MVKKLIWEVNILKGSLKTSTLARFCAKRKKKMADDGWLMAVCDAMAEARA